MKPHAELYRSLEFDKIVAHLKQFALSPMGRELCDRLPYFTEIPAMEQALDETLELREALEHDDPFPLSDVHDLREAFRNAEVKGNYLSPESLVRVAQTLRTGARVRGYLKERQDNYPRLWKHAEELSDQRDLVRETNRAIDFETFEVKDSASPKLKAIRREIVQTEAKCRRVVEELFKKYSKQGLLQEDVITLREGRLVLPVKLGSKSSIPGLVHGHSASGSTLFVEPFEAVELNNHVSRLRGEETQEIERILRELTSQIRQRLPELQGDLTVLAALDFIHAKARFALELGCERPRVTPQRVVEIIQGRHPLLMLREGGSERVVPLDLKIGDGFRILVVTGPNTGGKTVALKTVGLLTLMTHSGLLIPAHPDSTIGAFDTIFTDIGDLQSIEQDLSTYSSHIKRLREVLERADAASLVLIDELGAGTDPEEGAALATAILERLKSMGCATLVTTHLGALKVFAHEAEGVENGSMEFDVQTLQPRYRFRPGMPGSSYALEIAQRLGIPDEVLHRARVWMGTAKGNMEKLLLEVQEKMQEYTQLKNELEVEKARLDGLMKLYRERAEAIKKEERTLKEKALHDAQEIVRQANAAVEQAIREIREAQASREAIAAARRKLEAQRTKIAEELQNIDVPETQPEDRPPPEPRVGLRVVWKPHNSEGTIVGEADASGKVLLQIGNFKFRVPVEELYEASGEADAPDKRRGQVRVQVDAKSDTLPEIDVRGRRLDEAVSEVDKFLDDAVLAGWREVRIIHGKGTGALRKGISDFLQDHPRVKNKRFGAWNEGDVGVTMVELS